MYHYYDNGNKISKQFKFKKTVGTILLILGTMATAYSARRRDESGTVGAVISSGIAAGGLTLLSTPSPRKLEKPGTLIIEKVRDIQVDCCCATKTDQTYDEPNDVAYFVRQKQGQDGVDSILNAYYTRKMVKTFDDPTKVDHSKLKDYPFVTFNTDKFIIEEDESTNWTYTDGINTVLVQQLTYSSDVDLSSIDQSIIDAVNKTHGNLANYARIKFTKNNVEAIGLPRIVGSKLTFNVRTFVIDGSTSQTVTEFIARKPIDFNENVTVVPALADILGILWERRNEEVL